MNTPDRQTNDWRLWRRSFIVLAGVVTLIGLFYTEENWRGKHAWNNCKRGLESRGINFTWADYIPAPVPADRNVFGVPEMQQWFTGRGATELSRALAYPRLPGSNASRTSANNESARLVVAELTIGSPGTNSGNRSNSLLWGDPQVQEELASRIKAALGPVALHPGSSNLLFTPRLLDEIRPAQIILECPTPPSTNDLAQVLPRVGACTDTTDLERLQLEPKAGGYKVTMPAPDTTAAFLKWADQFDSDFALIREALRRPDVRMEGNYSAPEEVAIPNFLTARIFVQTLAAITECHLLEGHPEAAFNALTRMHELCRIFTNRPITLVGAMVNVAVCGLYVDTIVHGLRWQAWGEAQLAALEEQLKTIDIIAPLHESLHLEVVSGCENLQSLPPERLYRMFFADPAHPNRWNDFKAGLLPRGWIYQNMVVTARRAPAVDTWIDPVKRGIFPKQVDAGQPTLSEHSPYSFIAAAFVPNIRKACQRTAINQTKLHQAIIACALERYRLAHGEYPAGLDALVPGYLSQIPADVIGGQAPHYRRAANGTFLLYSIGWDERDGGGTAAKSSAEGDWVWPEVNLL